MHEHDPDQRPDSEFSPGALNLLCPGNSGRMLDPRRTPVTIVGVTPEIGMFELEVTAFEDAGARWILPLEDVENFQFEKGSATADDRRVATYEQAVARFGEDLTIGVDDRELGETRRRIAIEQEVSAHWLNNHSAFLRSSGAVDLEESTGPDLLRSDLSGYMETRELADIERLFTETWVSNPRSGEVVKAHQIVMARMGLAPFDGQVLRNPRSLSGSWSRKRREDHIVARAGFLRSMFEHLGIDTVVLYRGLAFEHRPSERRKPTLISATFRRSVAESWLDSDPMWFAASLIREPVPVDRLFMTYLETEAMNTMYEEAEAVLFSEPSGILF